MKLVCKSTNGVEANVSVRFIYNCFSCGQEETVFQLNPYGGNEALIDDKRTASLTCNKCGHTDTFTMTLEAD